MKRLEIVKISGIVSGVGFTETFADGSGSYSEKICETLYDTGNDNKDAAESKKWANTIVTAVNNTYHKGINPEAVPELLEALKIAKNYIDVFLIRDEDPLLGENIKTHSYMIIEALKKATL